MDASQGVGHELPDGSRERRRRRRITLAIGLTLVVAGLVATLSHAAVRRTGANGMPAKTSFGTTAGAPKICQPGERIPSGTAALRVSLVGTSQAPPRLSVSLLRGDATQASGAAARWDRPSASWHGGSVVLVPLAPTLRDDVFGSVCIRLPRGGAQQYGLMGVPTYADEGTTVNGQHLPGRLHFDYLQAGERSWWSLAPALARRIGRGHAWSGPSVALLVALLMLTSIVLGAWQLSRDDD